MTTSRVIRGTRAKIFLYICVILIITGLIACYNNTLSQLEDARKASENCHQHEENLSTQLQGITEYKERLEKSLKNEKVKYQQTKDNLETKLNEEKSRCDSDSNQSKVKFNALQHHYNLLETEYGDYKEKCSKNEQSQQEEINSLKANLKELQEKLEKVKTSKENLKSQYIELLSSKDKLEQRVNDFAANDDEHENSINRLTKENHDLKRELEEMKGRVNQDSLPEPKLSLYNASPVSPSASQMNKGALKPPDTNSLNLPDPIENQPQGFLAKPGSELGIKPSSSTSTLKSALKPSQASLDNALPLKQPTVTPETIAKNRGVIVGVQDNLKIPEGVVPAPEHKEDPKVQQEVEDNRYKNVKESANVEQAADKGAGDLDKENGAHEEFDNQMGQNFGLGFGENDNVKTQEKQDKKPEKNLNKEDEELQNDVLLEENEEDDDADGFEDRAARLKEPAVRN